MKTLDEKMQALRKILEKLPAAAVALSGGVDSSLLLALVARWVPDPLALTAVSPIFKEADQKQASQVAGYLKVSHLKVVTCQLHSQDFMANSLQRCYICKKETLRRLQEAAGALGHKVLLDGTTAEDSRDYRPGQKAGKEMGLLSPLASAGLGKEEIRLLARQEGLPNWHSYPSSCLATRIPYGEAITVKKIEAIAHGEAFLENMGFHGVRLRHHGRTARLELLPGEMARAVHPTNAAEIAKNLKSLGFEFVALDLEGYRPAGRGGYLS